LPKTNSDEGKDLGIQMKASISIMSGMESFFVRPVALEQPCRPQRPKIDDAIVIMDQWPYIVIQIQLALFTKGGSVRKFSIRKALTLVLFFSAGVLFAPLYAWPDTPTMTKEELKAHLGVMDFVIIDVRAAGDWKKAEDKIKGAVREEPDVVKDWASKYPKDKAMVLYCA
jgi:hypothetical protein